MSRLPLLRRTTAEMSILLSAATLCRIRRDTFFGVMPSLPTGSICADSSVGVPINSARSRISSERRMTMRPPSSSGCVRLSDISSHTFSALRSSVSSRYSMSRPMQESVALPLPRLSSTSVKLESTAPLMAVVPEMRLNTSSASSFRRWWIKRMAMPWAAAIRLSAERAR